MPLRDHFHLPWSEQNPWEGFHSAWVNTMVRHLNSKFLPAEFRAIPRVSLSKDQFEIRVFDNQTAANPVAVVRLLTPETKNEGPIRRGFVTACAADLQSRKCVVIIDIVNSKEADIFREVFGALGCCPGANQICYDLYAFTMRVRNYGDNLSGDVWAEALWLDKPLPTIPLWVSEQMSVPLNLESSYEETCQVLRIGPA